MSNKRTQLPNALRGAVLLAAAASLALLMWRLWQTAMTLSTHNAGLTLASWVLAVIVIVAGTFAMTLWRRSAIGAGLTLVCSVITLATPGMLGWAPMHEVDAVHVSGDPVMWFTEQIPPPALHLSLAASCAALAGWPAWRSVHCAVPTHSS